MLRESALVLFALALSTVSCAKADANGFHIFTRVYHEGAAADGEGGSPGRGEVISRNLTLFHAGKVYDYIQALGEVVVFEPAHRRFVVLNTTQSMAAVVSFDELRNLLKVARQEAGAAIERLAASDDPSARQAAALLAFQLAPQFDKQFDAGRQRLTLSAPVLRYDVSGSVPPSPDVVEMYLQYADWMCQLNYVLHKSASFPEPRLAVNAALRRQGLIPTQVELRADEGRLHLRAQHEIHWELDARDRSLIHGWETMLKSRNLRRVSIHEYQRALLVSQAGRRGR